MSTSSIWESNVLEEKMDRSTSKITRAIATRNELVNVRTMASEMYRLKLARYAFICGVNRVSNAIAHCLAHHEGLYETIIRSILVASAMSYAKLPLTTYLPIYMTNRIQFLHQVPAIELVSDACDNFERWTSQNTDLFTTLEADRRLDLETLYTISRQFYKDMRQMRLEYVKMVKHNDARYHQVWLGILHKMQPPHQISLPTELCDSILKHM